VRDTPTATLAHVRVSHSITMCQHLVLIVATMCHSLSQMVSCYLIKAMPLYSLHYKFNIIRIMTSLLAVKQKDPPRARIFAGVCVCIFSHTRMTPYPPPLALPMLSSVKL